MHTQTHTHTDTCTHTHFVHVLISWCAPVVYLYWRRWEWIIWHRTTTGASLLSSLALMWWWKRSNLQVRALGHGRGVPFPLSLLPTTTTFIRHVPLNTWLWAWYSCLFGCHLFLTEVIGELMLHMCLADPSLSLFGFDTFSYGWLIIFQGYI